MKRIATSEDVLHDMALKYLERFNVPVAGMRRYLTKKVKAAADEGVAYGDAMRWMENVIERLCRVGLLNDERWAERRTESLRRKGKSRRAIAQDLRRKGIAERLRDTTLEADSEDPHAELRAAMAYARRRRLGPWAPQEQQRERRQKHLASLGRQGFAFDVARTVVDAASTEELQQRLEPLD